MTLKSIGKQLFGFAFSKYYLGCDFNVWTLSGVKGQDVRVDHERN